MSADIPVIAVTLDFDELPSFIHWKEMFRGIAAAGGTPVAIDCGKLRSDLPAILRAVDGLLISGGVDVDPALYGGDRDDPRIQRINPARDENELTALDLARAQEMPILAICRGAQLTNVALGGTLYADLARDWPGRTGHWHSEEALIRSLHSVRIEADTLLSHWTGTCGAVSVNSQHHQGLKTLAPQARVAARTDDGLVEAFEVEHERIVAVQWHPEVLWRSEPHALDLLRHFAIGTRRDDQHTSVAAGRRVPDREGPDDDSRLRPNPVVGEQGI